MLLGLTGGIATGKSTFCRLLAERHPFVVFDADTCVHNFLAEDPIVAQAVRGEFGPTVFAPDGSIERAALRAIVFQNPRQRKVLEQVLHPLVRRRWEDLHRACRRDGRDLLADIPLLFEVGAAASFDSTILVAASRHTQEDRLAARGIGSATAQAMLASQWPVSDKFAPATVVVWNDGTEAALQCQAALLIESLFPLTA